MRHKWNKKVNKITKTNKCVRCGIIRLSKPYPFGMAYHNENTLEFYDTAPDCFGASRLNPNR
jgi:hypothetical protein